MGNKPGFRSSTAGIVIGDANVAFCSLDGSSSTDAFGVSVGNTSQRPTSPKTGMFRWNTDVAAFEAYNGTIWVPIGGGTVTWKSNGTTIISVGVANFVNTNTLTWNIQSNGSQVNISATGSGGSGGGGGTVNVGANGTYTLNVSNVNFLNTVTVNVSVSANQGNTANIAFNVNNAIMNATFAVMNATFAISNGNMDAANAAIASLNAAEATQNSYFGTVNAAFATDNAYFATVNSAFAAGNAADATQNAYFSTVNSAFATLNTGSSSDRNTVATFANGTIVLPNANINFNNTATVNVAASANGTTQSNVAFNANQFAILAGVYSGNSANIIVTHNANGNVSIDSNGTTTIIQEEVFTATANQTVFTLVNQVANPIYYIVTRNGILQTPNVHYTYDQIQNVTFTANCSAGDEIAFREFTSVNVATNFSTTIITFTANATQNQTTFTLPTNISNSNYAIVSKNGLLELPTLDYSIVSNNQLVFSSNCNVNDRIEARLFPYVSMGFGGVGAVYANGVLVIPSGSINFNNSASITVQATANGTGQANVQFTTNTTTISSYQAVATTNQTAFTMSANCPGGQNYAFVTVNGVLQEPGTHYTISSNTALTFTSNLQSGDIVEARIMGIWTGGTAGTVKTLQQNVNLGLANANPGGGPNPTYFFVPGVCNFGLISQFTITTNQIGTFDVYVTSNTNNTGNVMLAASVYQSNTYNISTPWYYEADSSANGDNNLYVTINNWGAGTNLNVNVAIVRCAKFG